MTSIGDERAKALLDEAGITAEDLRRAIITEGRIRMAVSPGWNFSGAVGWALKDYADGRADWDRFTKANQAACERESAERDAGVSAEQAASNSWDAMSRVTKI